MGGTVVDRVMAGSVSTTVAVASPAAVVTAGNVAADVVAITVGAVVVGTPCPPLSPSSRPHAARTNTAITDRPTVRIADPGFDLFMCRDPSVPDTNPLIGAGWFIVDTVLSES